MDAQGAFGWSASLIMDTGGDVTAPVRSVALEADGRFELEGAPGEWRLRLHSPADVEPRIWVFADVLAPRLGDGSCDGHTLGDIARGPS